MQTYEDMMRIDNQQMHESRRNHNYAPDGQSLEHLIDEDHGELEIEAMQPIWLKNSSGIYIILLLLLGKKGKGT